MRIDEDQIKQATAAYTGPVTRCRPEAARGDRPVPTKPKPDLNAAGWLAPPPDGEERHRRRRMVLAQRRQIARRNAALLRQINKRKRKAKRKTLPIDAA